MKLPLPDVLSQIWSSAKSESYLALEPWRKRNLLTALKHSSPERLQRPHMGLASSPFLSKQPDNNQLQGLSEKRPVGVYEHLKCRSVQVVLDSESSLDFQIESYHGKFGCRASVSWLIWKSLSKVRKVGLDPLLPGIILGLGCGQGWHKVGRRLPAQLRRFSGRVDTRTV